MSTTPSAYPELLTRAAELADLEAAAALLGWDQEIYMPAGAQEARGHQAAALSGLVHARFTSAEMGALLDRLRSDEAPEDPDQRLAVENLAWDYERACRLPEDLVRETAQVESASVAAWTEARPRNDFAAWRPHLERVLELKRRRADCLRREGQSRYDALIEDYERGVTSAEVAHVFTELRDAIVPLIERIATSSHPVSTVCVRQTFDCDKQWEFGLEALRAIGFDFERGRLDRSAHPFTTGLHPTDVRLTTRLHPEHLCSGLFSSLHEGGHGLYDQGVAEADWRTPLGSSISLGIHESQSRLWENLVGRDLPFWRHFYPRLQALFPGQLDATPLEEFHRAINDVRPSLIRVEADEVTYSLHIILRFELEMDLIEERLDVRDLPEAWREKMSQYLGLRIPDDRDGCMQDIHWSCGLVGYFPTYTLGNLYSAQFYRQARRDLPGLDAAFERGDFHPLTGWLREKIHRVGRRRTAGQLIQDVTGEPLSARPYIEYLETKYAGIYRLG